MPCLITAPMRSELKETMRQKTTKKLAKTKISRQKQYLNLKANSNNVKMQSDKTLTTQI